MACSALSGTHTHKPSGCPTIMMKERALCFDSSCFLNDFSPFDVPTCVCDPFPPTAGFKKWSDPATWPSGKVPGVGAQAGGNATIPCNVAVLFDVPSVVLHTLTVRGLLKWVHCTPPHHDTVTVLEGSLTTALMPGFTAVTAH